MNIMDEDMPQEEYNEILARITELELLQLHGGDYVEELKELKEKIDYED